MVYMSDDGLTDGPKNVEIVLWKTVYWVCVRFI